MRPGYIASRVPNCSAMVSGEWLGSMTPPAPSRIVLVCAPTWAMSTLVADDAIERHVVVLGVPDPLVAGLLRALGEGDAGGDAARRRSHRGRWGPGRGWTAGCAWRRAFRVGCPGATAHPPPAFPLDRHQPTRGCRARTDPRRRRGSSRAGDGDVRDDDGDVVPGSGVLSGSQCPADGARPAGPRRRGRTAGWRPGRRRRVRPSRRAAGRRGGPRGGCSRRARRRPRARAACGARSTGGGAAAASSAEIIPASTSTCTNVWSRVSRTRSPSRSRYARLSPTCASASRPRRSRVAAVRVVAMPVSAGVRPTASPSRALAVPTARRIAASASSRGCPPRVQARASTASAAATAPPTLPPTPSATATRPGPAQPASSFGPREPPTEPAAASRTSTGRGPSVMGSRSRTRTPGPGRARRRSRRAAGR